MTRVEDITETLNKMQPLIERANVLLKQERVSYELIRGDLEALTMRKSKALEELEMIKQNNEEAKKTAENIIALAKEEANKTIMTARELNVDALRRLDEIKEFCTGIDKKKMQDYKKELEKV